MSEKNNKVVAAQLTERDSKKKMLDVVFSQIDKQYGKGSIMLLGQASSIHVDALPSGSLLLDKAIGCGGFPRGRIIEIYGPESSGKTTMALHAIAQAQKQGGFCAFIDAEHALDPLYAAKVGINIHDLIIAQPDYGEQALDIAETLIRSNAIDIIVIDSVAALVPKAELEGDMGDVHMGLQARLMSQALRKLTPALYKSKTVLIFINQIRSNMNAMAFASKETTTGGNALKFYASVRLDVRRIESLKKNDVHYGNRVRIKIAKNKMAPPFRTVELHLIFGLGISRPHELVDAGLQVGLITQSGSWFSYNGEKIGQGKDSVATYLKDNPKSVIEIESKILTHYGVKARPIGTTTTSTAKEKEEKTTNKPTTGKRAHAEEAKTN